MSKNNIVGAIEIGTDKVVVAIGEITDASSLNIIGIGEHPSHGIMKGEVVDFETASNVTHAAITAAEEKAGVHLNSVFLAQTGYHLQGFFYESSVNVSTSNGHVSHEDIERVVKDAKSKQLPEDRVYIHHIQNPFKLDGRITPNPMGMHGEKLEVGYWSIHGDLSKVRDHIHIVNSFGIKVEDVIVSSIASGSIIASQTDKMNGILVLDIGRGTTDYIVYRGGYVIQTGVIPIGGDHFTNDISLGLRIDSNQAEDIKKQYACAIADNFDDSVLTTIENLSLSRNITKNAVTQIVNARANELFSIIRDEIQLHVSCQNLAAGILITGGTSKMNGLDAVAKNILGVNVRLGENPTWACEGLREPEYSTILGLLNYALRSKEKRGVLKMKKIGIFNKVAKILHLT